MLSRAAVRAFLRGCITGDAINVETDMGEKYKGWLYQHHSDDNLVIVSPDGGEDVKIIFPSIVKIGNA